MNLHYPSKVLARFCFILIKKAQQSLHLFDPVKQYYLFKIYYHLKKLLHFETIYSCDGKAEFSVITPVFIDTF